jgi:hypothetical protein
MNSFINCQNMKYQFLKFFQIIILYFCKFLAFHLKLNFFILRKMLEVLR